MNNTSIQKNKMNIVVYFITSIDIIRDIYILYNVYNNRIKLI